MHKLTGIEAGRGIAALLVVGVHTWDHCKDAYGWFPLGSLFTFGHSGVDFFFVLSGFIIDHVHYADIGQYRRFAHYARQRFTRIYPFYWCVLILTLVGTALSTHPLPSLSTIAKSLTLAPFQGDEVVGVAWTLRHEVVFYTVFALLILRRRLGQAVFSIWFILIIVRLLLSDRWASPWPLSEFASYFDLEFFMGIAAARLLRVRTIFSPGLLLSLSIIGFIAVGLAENASLIRGLATMTHLGYGIAAMGIVLGLVETERQGRLVIPPLLGLLGGASYAIYLVHILSTGAVWQILLAAKVAPLMPAWITFIVLVAAAVISGTLISLSLEKPLIALTRRIISGAVPESLLKVYSA